MQHHRIRGLDRHARQPTTDPQQARRSHDQLLPPWCNAGPARCCSCESSGRAVVIAFRATRAPQRSSRAPATRSCFPPLKRTSPSSAVAHARIGRRPVVRRHEIGSYVAPAFVKRSSRAAAIAFHASGQRKSGLLLFVQGTRELSVAVGSLRGSLRGDAIATASLSRSVQGAGAGGYGVFPGGRGRKRCCCVDGGERVRCLT
jgi:hypothetical protein